MSIVTSINISDPRLSKGMQQLLAFLFKGMTAVIHWDSQFVH